MIKVVVENSLKNSCLLILAKNLEMKQIVAKFESKCISIEGRNVPKFFF